jgi:hypothetical protein
MSFRKDNTDYEAWLHTQCTVVEADLRLKHRKMRETAFVFLRGTYFRWAKGIEELCPELAGAPAVLAVGDLHLENFGAWRDAEGRWVWGVNDFDEAAVMPYPFDLVRLATSARLMGDLPLGNRAAAAAILDGYARGLADPRATLLDESQPELRDFVRYSDSQRRKFWADLQGLKEDDPGQAARRDLKASLPAGSNEIRFTARAAGCGSLGRPRYVAMADWRGGPVAREAKALVRSAWDWAHGDEASPSRLMDIATGAYRCPDPFLQVKGGFVMRRIAPGSRKIELEGAGAGLTAKLLAAMGFDLGAIHAADKAHARAVSADLERRPPDWLQAAAKAAARWVEADHQAYSR